MSKSDIHDFVNNLILQDYVLFGGVLLLFLLLIILAILLRHKFKTALFLILLSFTLLVIGPTYGYIAMHSYLFANKVEVLSKKELHYVDAVVVQGRITNSSKRDFRECKLTASAYKITSNKFKDFIYELKPFKKMSITIDGLAKGESKEYKILVEPFRYSKEYNISVGADCR